MWRRRDGVLSRRDTLRTLGGVLTLTAGRETILEAPRPSPSELVGVLEGSRGSPVSVDEIEQTTQRVLKHGADVHPTRKVVTNNTRAEQRTLEQALNNPKEIVAYGIAWTNETPEIVVHRLPRETLTSEAAPPIQRIHDELAAFADPSNPDRVSTNASTSDGWKPLGAVSESSWVYGGPDGETRFGQLRHTTEAYRSTTERKSQTDDYAVTQTGETRPACDNNWGNGAINAGTRQVQDWGRSELTPVDHLDHQPTTDVTGTIDTRLSSSYGGGSITVDTESPWITRDVDYVVEEQARTQYSYPLRLAPFAGGARRSNCTHEQIGVWRTDPISSDSADITASYYFGKFRNRGGVSYADNTFTLLTLNELQ